MNSIGGFIEDLCLGSARLLLPECLRETKEKHDLKGHLRETKEKHDLKGNAATGVTPIEDISSGNVTRANVERRIEYATPPGTLCMVAEPGKHGGAFDASNCRLGLVLILPFYQYALQK